MANENLIHFTDQNFDEEVIKSEQPVLVDFWAEWCMPCRLVGPVIEKVATEYAGRAKVGKLDTDANRDAAMRYMINAIPTVLVFKGGQVVNKIVGVRAEKDYKAAIDSALQA